MHVLVLLFIQPFNRLSWKLVSMLPEMVQTIVPKDLAQSAVLLFICPYARAAFACLIPDPFIKDGPTARGGVI